MEELADAGFGIIQYAYILGAELIIKCVKREDAPADRDSAGPGGAGGPGGP
jgi:hypothetical protein